MVGDDQVGAPRDGLVGDDGHRVHGEQDPAHLPRRDLRRPGPTASHDSAQRGVVDRLELSDDVGERTTRAQTTGLRPET